MADHFITTSFEITITSDEASLLTECFDVADIIFSDFPDYPEAGLDTAKACFDERSAAFKATFPPLPEEEDPFAGFLQLWFDPEFPTFDATLSIGDDSDSEKRVALLRGECVDVFALAGVIQKVCVSALPFGFEWAQTCSRTIPRMFGGGYFVISTNTLQGGSTGHLMRLALDVLLVGSAPPDDGSAANAKLEQDAFLTVADEQDARLDLEGKAHDPLEKLN
jgi:hypothetical protein